MGVRLLPEDDLMHPRDEASNFNESAYYNFYDDPGGPGFEVVRPFQEHGVTGDSR